MHSTPNSPEAPSRAEELRRNPWIWLSGSGFDVLSQCSEAEVRKHGAIGFTVLVPTLFGFIAAAYAVSTLTTNPFVIVPVALVWAFIILIIDRVIIATYRAYQDKRAKAFQFGLRLTVALLMGLTISHPLTLLLFKDTIHGEIAAQRDEAITLVREDGAREQSAVESRIKEVESSIQEQRRLYQESFDASFVTEDQNLLQSKVATDLAPEEVTARAARVAEVRAPLESRLAEVAALAATVRERQTALQEDLDFWQKEFEAEVNGTRSGITGLGPRARSIQEDQLQWRRAEMQSLVQQTAALAAQRAAIDGEMADLTASVYAEFDQVADDRAARAVAERERVAAIKRQLQEDQAAVFADRQDGVRQQIQAQIDSDLEELSRLRNELGLLGASMNARIAGIQAEPRRDLLTQTLALHEIFRHGSEGGLFALGAYLVLAGLFMVVDTMPILVKFTTKAGPYDEILEAQHRAELPEGPHEEEIYDTERLMKLERTRQSREMLAAAHQTTLLKEKQRHAPLEASLKPATPRTNGHSHDAVPREHVVAIPPSSPERFSPGDGKSVLNPPADRI